MTIDQVRLLVRVRDGKVTRRGSGTAVYDWDEVDGRDVTMRMAALRRRQLVSLVPSGRGEPGRNRLTKAGHDAIAVRVS